MSREKLSESYPRIKPGPLILILFEAPLLRTIIWGVWVCSFALPHLC